MNVTDKQGASAAAYEFASAIVQEQCNAMTPTCVFCGGNQIADDGEEHTDDCVYMRAEAYLAQPVAAQVEAAPQAEQVAKAEPRTHMSDEQAEKWAWEQVKKDVGTDGWTVGDSCNYFGFFLWGWRYRSQYERQRATPERAATPAELLSAVLNCYSPDDTISDYQDKIRGVFATARAADGDASSPWISVDERLPSHGQMVIVSHRTEYVNAPAQQSVSCAVFDGCNWCAHGHHLYTPTHWRPMPAAPSPNNSPVGGKD